MGFNNDREKMPLVSVIMGVYNCADTLDRSIESIRNQTYPNWEFIICDDASTDDTLEVLKKWQSKDNRIVVLHNEKNARLAATLNKCLEQCSGKYVARMDGDDESLPLRFEKQVEFLEKHTDIDCVGTASELFDENGTYGTRMLKEYPEKEDLLLNPIFMHPTIMMKAEVYRELGGYTVSKKTMRAEDLDLWFRFCAAGHQGYNLQEVLFRYNESVEGYQKRTFEAAIETAKVFKSGYELIGIVWYKRIFALKPIISYLLPSKYRINRNKRKYL